MTADAIVRSAICWLAGGSMLFAVLAVQASEGASPLSFDPVEVDGSEAMVAEHMLELVGPDAPEAPTLWEGPILVRDSAGLRCTLDAELVGGLFADSAGDALLVVSRSGANTYLSVFDLDDCAIAAASGALFTEGVEVSGTRIEVQPGCECPLSPETCTCVAAKVLRVEQDLTMREDVQASRALTRAQLGVAFAGEARLARPGGPGARILDD